MKSIKRIWNSFKIAFSMYSRIPMPRSEWTDENKSYAMCFFPWIGAVIGLLSYGVFRFSKWFDGNGGGNYSLFFVIFLILIPVFITGGIHLDGFLDTQDALSSWQTKERRLEILKDSHAGAFAIISCTIYFLMYIGVYSCLSVRSMEVIAYSFMLSRTLSGLSVVTFPQARKKGGRFFGKCIDQNYKNGIGHLSDCTVFPDSTDRRDLRNRMCDLGRRGIWILLPDGDEEFRRCDRGSVWIFPAGM